MVFNLYGLNTPFSMVPNQCRGRTGFVPAKYTRLLRKKPTSAICILSSNVLFFYEVNECI